MEIERVKLKSKQAKAVANCIAKEIHKQNVFAMPCYDVRTGGEVFILATNIVEDGNLTMLPIAILPDGDPRDYLLPPSLVVPGAYVHVDDVGNEKHVFPHQINTFKLNEN